MDNIRKVHRELSNNYKDPNKNIRSTMIVTKFKEISKRAVLFGCILERIGWRMKDKSLNPFAIRFSEFLDLSNYPSTWNYIL